MTNKEERFIDMKYTNCMDKVKKLELLPKFNAATKAMLAEYFEVAVHVVGGDIARHRKELSKFGLKKARYNDFEKCGYSFERSDYAHTRVYVYENSEINVTNAGILLLPKEAIFSMAERLNSPIAERIRLEVRKLSEGNESTDSDVKEAQTIYNKEETQTDKVQTEKIYKDMEKDNMDFTNNTTERMITEDFESNNTNSLQIFNNEEFGEMRTVAIDGEPWFVGKDVAVALGYTNPRKAIIDHVDEEDKGVTKCDTLGGMQNLTVINESGLYSLVLSSKLPSAKKFKRWVTSEVIPSIRKHGAYMTPQTIAKAILNPDFIINLAGRLKGEMEKNKQLSFELEQERIKSENLLESNAELVETNKSLAVDNDALVKENATWNHKSIINALMRAYGKKYCNGVIPYAYGILYKELSYKHHIDLKKRKGESKSSYIDLLKVKELDKAVQVAAAMCKNKGMDISRTINEINAAIIS